MKYLLFILILVSEIYSQFLAPPFTLDKKINFAGSYVAQLNRQDGNTFLFVYEKKAGSIPGRFRISDANYAVLNAFNFIDESVLQESINIIDINNDGDDEVLFLSQKKGIVSLKIIFPFSAIEKTLLVLGKKRENYYSTVKVIQTDSTINLFIVGFGEHYPSENAFRGIALFNCSSLELEKYLPFADMTYYLNYNKSSNSIVYTTSAVDNGLTFDSKTLKYSHKGVPGESILEHFARNKLILFPNSADSASYLREITLDGEILFEAKLGGAFCWSSLIFTKNDNYLVSSKYHSVNSDPKFTIKKYNPRIRKLIDLITLNKSEINLFSSSYLEYSAFIYTAENEIVKTINADAKIETVIDLNNYFKKNDAKYLGVDEDYIYINTNDSIYAFNKNGDIFFKESGNNFPIFLNKFNLFAFVKDNQIFLHKMRKLSLFERITPNTYYYSTIILGSSSIIVLFFWLLTMSISKKKIIKQKEEIERSHDELREATLKLIQSEKLAVLGTIASSVAHELNSPLGAILNSAERINRIDDLDIEIKQNSSLIEKSALRSKTIIEKFLLASRKNTTNEITNVAEVINDWKELFEKQFILSNINLLYDIDVNLKVNMPYEELNQVFINLLFNARDAVTGSKKSVKNILISVKSDEDKAVIKISDSGDGFEPEILENAFDAFVTTKEPGKGTGLGLWICKKIITDAKGSIQIQNTDEGAIVEIKLDKYDK